MARHHALQLRLSGRDCRLVACFDPGMDEVPGEVDVRARVDALR